ncbi:MAG: hypothetical protein ACK5OB_14640 [Pirellula sp.]
MVKSSHLLLVSTLAGAIVGLLLALQFRVTSSGPSLVSVIGFGILTVIACALLGLAVAGIAIFCQKGALEKQRAPRVLFFGALGCISGMLLSIPAMLIFATPQRPQDAANALTDRIALLIGITVFAGVGMACYGLLTRKAAPFETFLPSTTTKPTNPWPGAIVLFILIAIGTTSRLRMLWQSTDSDMDVVIAIAALAWIAIGAFLIRLSFRRYKKRLDLYHQTIAEKEGNIPEAQSLGSADAR